MWWSRVRQPDLHAWAADGQPLQLVEQTVAKKQKGKTAPAKALACYGLYAHWRSAASASAATLREEAMWLRFVEGRPVSAVTTTYLQWCVEQAAARQQRVLLLIWDNAAWHVSKAVRAWVHRYNQQVKQAKGGVRLLICCLPTKSPWLNPIEPKWMHGKRHIVEPARLLTAAEVAERVCACFGCLHEPHLSMIEEVS